MGSNEVDIEEFKKRSEYKNVSKLDSNTLFGYDEATRLEKLRKIISHLEKELASV